MTRSPSPSRYRVSVVSSVRHTMRDGKWDTDQLQKLTSRACVGAEAAEHRACTRGRVLLLDSAHRHAEVRRFDDHRDAERIDFFADRLGDLVRHSLLDLQPACEHFDEAWNLAEANHLSLRDVGDVALAEKRQQMMFAQ